MWYKGYEKVFQCLHVIAFSCLYLAEICGDICNAWVDGCECGDTTIGQGSGRYCCIPINETCFREGMESYIVCIII